jgi:hypothetical protein
LRANTSDRVVNVSPVRRSWADRDREISKKKYSILNLIAKGFKSGKLLKTTNSYNGHPWIASRGFWQMRQISHNFCLGTTPFLGVNWSSNSSPSGTPYL